MTAVSASRVLFYVEHFALAGSGAENDAVQLCRALAARGWEVHVAARTGAPCPDVQVHLDSFERLAQVTVGLQPDATVDWGFFHQADLHRLGGGIHRAYHALSLAAYHGPARWLRQLRLRTGKDRAVLAREAELLRRPAARFLAISRFVARQALAAGAAPHAVSVLHNAVDTQRFHPAAVPAARVAVRQRWRAGDDAVVYLFVAHNLRLKNLALLQRVFPAVVAACPGARLVVVGRRPPPWSAPWLHWDGPSAAMEQLYPAADVLVHPSFFDAFGNVVLEAMSCGLPVLVSDVSGASELVTSGQDGVVLPVSGAANVAAPWRDQLLRLARETAWRQQLGAAARVTARHHDFAEYVPKFEAVLRECVAARAATVLRP